MEPDLPAAAKKRQDLELGVKGGHNFLRVRVMIDPPPPSPPSLPPARPAAAATATATATAGRLLQQQQEAKPVHTVVNLTAEALSARSLLAVATSPLVRVAGRPSSSAAAAAAVAAAASGVAAVVAVATPHPLPPAIIASPSSPLRAAVATALALVLFPLGAAGVALYVSLAFFLAVVAVSCVWPSVLLAARFYETLPFARDAFGPRGPIRARVSGGAAAAVTIRCAFESAHATAVLGRLLTVPLRRATPTLYVAGLAKCGTTTLAAYLRRERGVVFPAGAVPAPAAREGEERRLLSLAGLAEAASKETHYLTGVLGRGGGGGGGGGGGRRSSPAVRPPSAMLYRSFFPIFAGGRWWTWSFWRAQAGRLVGEVQLVSRAPRPIVVDATPTYAAVPLVARRIRLLTPGARVVVIVRDPVDALASAEGMMRSLGALGPRGEGWRLSEPVAGGGDGGGGDGGDNDDPRFSDLAESARLWKALEDLPPGAAIPPGLCRRMCALDGGGLGGAVEAAKAGARVAHLARVLGAGAVMVVAFADLVEAPERVVAGVLAFARGGGGGEEGAGAVLGGRSAAAAAAAGAKVAFRPLERRMTGTVVVDGSAVAAAAGGGGERRGGAPHPSVRALLDAAAFAEDRRLLGELTGVDPAVLLRRPAKAGGGGGKGGGAAAISLSASAV